MRRRRAALDCRHHSTLYGGLTPLTVRPILERAAGPTRVAVEPVPGRMQTASTFEARRFVAALRSDVPPYLGPLRSDRIEHAGECQPLTVGGQLAASIVNPNLATSRSNRRISWLASGSARSKSHLRFRPSFLLRRTGREVFALDEISLHNAAIWERYRWEWSGRLHRRCRGVQ